MSLQRAGGAGGGELGVGRMDFDAEPRAGEVLGGDCSGAGAEEGVEHDVAGVSAHGDEFFDEGHGFLGGVAAFFLGGTFEAGDAEDVGGEFACLKVGEACGRVFVALVAHVGSDFFRRIGSADGVFAKFGFVGFAEDEDEFVSGGEAIAAFVVAHGAVPDDEVVEGPAKGGRGHDMEESVFAFAKLPEEEQETIRTKHTHGLGEPLEHPFVVGGEAGPLVVPGFTKDLEVGRIGDNGLDGFGWQEGQKPDGIALVDGVEGQTAGGEGAGDGVWVGLIGGQGLRRKRMGG